MSDERNSAGAPDTSADVAAEYVLGTLTAEERKEAEHRFANDPAFAREVAQWNDRLAPLLDAIPESDAPEGVLYDVRQAIGLGSYDAMPPPAMSQETENVIRFDLAERAMRRWRQRAVAGGAIAACLLAFVFFREIYTPATGTGTFVAVLESEGRDPAFVAILDTRSGAVAIRRVGVAPAAGKSHELWAVGGGRDKPQSLGVVEANNDIPQDVFKRGPAASYKETTFAISLEPEGGSTTGQPTGPVIFTGKLVPAPASPRLGFLERLREVFIRDAGSAE